MTYFFLQFWKWPNLSYTVIEIKTQYITTKKRPKQQLMLRELTNGLQYENITTYLTTVLSITIRLFQFQMNLNEKENTTRQKLQKNY
jgi:hypothetical protein